MKQWEETYSLLHIREACTPRLSRFHRCWLLSLCWENRTTQGKEVINVLAELNTCWYIFIIGPLLSCQRLRRRSISKLTNVWVLQFSQDGEFCAKLKKINFLSDICTSHTRTTMKKTITSYIRVLLEPS